MLWNPIYEEFKYGSLDCEKISKMQGNMFLGQKIILLNKIPRIIKE